MADFEESKQIEKLLDVDCPSCGSKLFYSAEHRQISCHHCGYKEDYQRDNGQVVELDLNAALQQLTYFVPEKTDKKVYDCKSCGAKFMVDVDKTRVNCGFCGSENVNLEAFDHKYIQPSGILPFEVPKKKAEDLFKDWVGKGWFHPGKLKTLARLDGLHGVYIPFWTFDADTSSDWKGEAGFNYYESVRVKVGDSYQQQQVKKVRWEWRSGHLNHFFDDVIVSASSNLEQRFLDRILPFKMEQTVNFDARLMVGWESEIYGVELDQGWKKGNEIMDEQLRFMCMQALGGDTQRNLSVKTEKCNETYKHVILPVWLCSYRFNEKIYRFVINGQTGKVHGQKPIAWWKVILVILIFVLFIASIVWMRESGIFAGD